LTELLHLLLCLRHLIFDFNFGLLHFLFDLSFYLVIVIFDISFNIFDLRLNILNLGSNNLNLFFNTSGLSLNLYLYILDLSFNLWVKFSRFFLDLFYFNSTCFDWCYYMFFDIDFHGLGQSSPFWVFLSIISIDENNCVNILVESRQKVFSFELVKDVTWLIELLSHCISMLYFRVHYTLVVLRYEGDNEVKHYDQKENLSQKPEKVNQGNDDSFQIFFNFSFRQVQEFYGWLVNVSNRVLKSV